MLNRGKLEQREFQALQLENTAKEYVNWAVRLVSFAIRHALAPSDGLPLSAMFTPEQRGISLHLHSLLLSQASHAPGWSPSTVDEEDEAANVWIDPTIFEDRKEPEDLLVAQQEQDEEEEDLRKQQGIFQGGEMDGEQSSSSESPTTNSTHKNTDADGMTIMERNINDATFQLLNALFFTEHPNIETEWLKDPIRIFLLSCHVNPKNGNFTKPTNITPNIAGIQYCFKPIAIRHMHEAAKNMPSEGRPIFT